MCSTYHTVWSENAVDEYEPTFEPDPEGEPGSEKNEMRRSSNPDGDREPNFVRLTNLRLSPALRRRIVGTVAETN